MPFTYMVAMDLYRSRRLAVLSGVLAIVAGPLLIMYPTIGRRCGPCDRGERIAVLDE